MKCIKCGKEIKEKEGYFNSPEGIICIECYENKKEVINVRNDTD